MSTLLAEHERRASDRWATYKSLQWRVRGQRRVCTGIVVERSLSGLVLDSEAEDAPEIGSYIKPEGGAMAERHGFRVGLVVRAGDEINARRLLYVEILA